MDRGTKIKQAREALGWTQKDLADRAGISDSYVRHIEGGARPGTDEVVERIGAALGQDFRSEIERASTRAGAHELVRVPPRKRRDLETHAEDLALREYKTAVEKGLPVPVTDAFASLPAIASRSGIPVTVEIDTFESRVEGMTWCADKQGAIYCQVRADVYDRALRGEPRDRFTVAHEIAHVLLHFQQLMSDPGAMFRDQDVMKPSERAAVSALKVYEIADWQANAWAAAFLMSSQAIKTYLRTQDDLGNEVVIDNIARHFQVSVQAAEFRMSTALPALGRI